MAKPKKATYAELKAQLDAAEQERSLLEQALSCTVNDNVDARAVTERDEYGARYELRLYRATGAMGGFIVQLFDAPGQKVTVSVRTLDNAIHGRKSNGDSDYWRYFSPAIDKLDMARNKLNHDVHGYGRHSDAYEAGRRA